MKIRDAIARAGLPTDFRIRYEVQLVADGFFVDTLMEGKPTDEQWDAFIAKHGAEHVSLLAVAYDRGDDGPPVWSFDIAV